MKEIFEQYEGGSEKGGERRSYAEWNADAENGAEIESEKREKSATIKKSAKKLFVLAFIGLLLDFVLGIGAFLCLPVAIVATVRALRLYREEKKYNAKLVWAATVGWLGALFGVPFFILMI